MSALQLAVTGSNNFCRNACDSPGRTDSTSVSSRQPQHHWWLAFPVHLTIIMDPSFHGTTTDLPLYLGQCNTTSTRASDASSRGRRTHLTPAAEGQTDLSVQRPQKLCAAHSPNFHIDDAASSNTSSSMTHELGGCRTNRVPALCSAHGRLLRGAQCYVHV